MDVTDSYIVYQSTEDTTIWKTSISNIGQVVISSELFGSVPYLFVCIDLQGHHLISNINITLISQSQFYVSYPEALSYSILLIQTPYDTFVLSSSKGISSSFYQDILDFFYLYRVSADY